MRTLLFILLTGIYSASAQTYCLPVPISSDGGDCVKSVKIGSLYNSTPCVGGLTGYVHSGTPPVLYRDSTYTLEIELDSTSHYIWSAVAIPFDTAFPSHYDFYTPNRFYSSLTYHNTLSVTIPHDATLGITRMRVSRHGSTSTSGMHICGSGIGFTSYGETQDYPLDIRNAPPISYLYIDNLSTTHPKIYPNPTSGELHTGNPTCIYNTFGQMVFSSDKSDIDISHLPNGIYYTSDKQLIQKQ